MASHFSDVTVERFFLFVFCLFFRWTQSIWSKSICTRSTVQNLCCERVKLKYWTSI